MVPRVMGADSLKHDQIAFVTFDDLTQHIVGYLNIIKLSRRFANNLINKCMHQSGMSNE